MVKTCKPRNSTSLFFLLYSILFSLYVPSLSSFLPLLFLQLYILLYAFFLSIFLHYLSCATARYAQGLLFFGCTNRVCRYLMGFLEAGGYPVARSLSTQKKHTHIYLSVVGFETKTYSPSFRRQCTP